MNKNKNLKPFPKGQSGNPKGRPRKIAKTISNKMIGMGYERVSSSEFKEILQLLFGMSKDELRSIARDDAMPFIFSYSAQKILSNNFNVYVSLLDHAFGKPRQMEYPTATSSGHMTPEEIESKKTLVREFISSLKKK